MPRYLRALVTLALSAALLALCACAGSNSAVCPVNDNIGACSCNGSTDNAGTAACATPAYLYAASLTGQLSAYPINTSTGELGAPVSTNGPVEAMGMAQVDHQFLYASNRQMGTGNSSVDAWSINLDTGALTPVSGSPFALGPLTFPAGMAVDNAGPFLYIADEFQIDALKIDASTGALGVIPGSPFPSGSNTFLVVDPLNRFLFASDDDPEGSVFAFTINPSNGTLTLVPGSPFPTVPASIVNTLPSQIVVDPTGTFVYTALQATNQIAGLSISSSTGTLTPIPGSPFATGSGPFQLAIAASGFLYASNAMDKTISGYSVNPTTGALIPISGSPFPIPTGALTIFGHFLYASGPGGEIFGFAIDSGSGALTPVPGSPVQGAGATVLTYVQ